MIKFQKIPRQTAGQKDGQNLFQRILKATAGGLASTTAVDWQLKVKDKCWSNQKLLHHSQHAKK